MGNSDILLGNDRITAIRRLLVTVGEGDDPNIELKPDIAGLNLGGGDGSHSEGDLRLFDKGGKLRIHQTAGEGGQSPGTTRALVHGPSGDLELGANGVENEDVAIRPKWAALSLGGGDGSNSDGDVKLIDRGGKTRLHLDGGGGGPADPSTNLYVDASTGSIHAQPQPVSDDAPHTHPLLYMYNSWSTDGRSWFDDGFPSERPVISHDEDSKLTGLMWDDGRFVFQSYYDEDSGSRFRPTPPIRNPERRRILTIEMGDERVGINTDEPEHPLHVDGEAHATKHVDLSDARCKTNVEGIDGPDALDAVQRLRGVRFEWDDDAPRVGSAADGQHLGFLAQEVEDVLPESVSRDDDGYRSMATSAVAPVLVEATKAQQDRIDRQQETIEDQQETIEDQQETIDAQRDALADLEERVARLEEATADDGETAGTERSSR